MPIPVYDYRADLTNLVVQPEIRSRFRRVELGPVPEVHSHDLGGETFVVMEGQIEFTVADEHVVCQQGQAIFVPPRTTHAVRAVGEQTGVIYLSVSPHVEPTHTFYGPQGQRLPPRYGVWRAAGGGDPETPATSATLLEGYREAAHRLAVLAQASLDRVNAADGKLGTGVPLKPTVDELWDGLRPLLEQVEVVERAWNALAQRAGG
ncbi:MAG: cupin domain-containing protein [Chloroflexota bacterium]|nr:cupin domain-containing protein [Chloroflexota bacterium]